MTPFQALMGVFAMNALGFAIWLPRIPDVRDALGLDVFTLSLCLVAAPFGTILGLLFSARLVRRMGIRRSCIATAIAGPLLIIPPAFAPNAPILGLLLFIWGLTWSLSEVAINAMANAIQRAEGRRIMSPLPRGLEFWRHGRRALGGNDGAKGPFAGGQPADRGTCDHRHRRLVRPCPAGRTANRQATMAESSSFPPRRSS